MDDEAKAAYGERHAARYDELNRHLEAEAPATVDFLVSLARGPVLELGIGTGRIAIPLHERGVEVEGIDASPAMVERMRTKPGGDSLRVSIDDFAGVDREGPFSLIFVVFNTFFALDSQEEQIRCFENVARRLTEDGVFVIEAFVPNPARFQRWQSLSVLDLQDDRVLLDARKHDAMEQRIVASQIVITPKGIELLPVRLRYVWPSELDLMARLAGMSLRERYGGWRREPFTSDSGRHVSVYERTASAYL